MHFFSRLDEHELDRILAGKATDDEFDDVATFFRELRRNLGEAPTPAVEARHLALIFEGVRAHQPSAPDPQALAPHGRRLRNPLRRLAARATIVAVGLAALAAFGGAAYAGVLPMPIQSEVAHLVRHVGIVLPDNSRHSPAQPTPSAPGTPGTPGASPAGSTGQPDQGSSNRGGGTRGGGTQGGGAQGDDTQGDGYGGGARGNGTQTIDGHQASSQSGDSGSQNTQTNGDQGPQPGADQGQPNDSGTQSFPNDQGAPNNDQGTPNSGVGAGDDQQENGATNGN